MVKNLLPMQETQVQFLVQEDPTCGRAIKPVLQSLEVTMTELACWNY